MKSYLTPKSLTRWSQILNRPMWSSLPLTEIIWVMAMDWALNFELWLRYWSRKSASLRS
ncbi:hypothetical protein C370_07309 [Cryptococcus neoformans A1-35-8]|nr:hypothetical protein C370_07309 [Cryptococcus neoformans var. grubii A1-35-8]